MSYIETLPPVQAWAAVDGTASALEVGVQVQPHGRGCRMTAMGARTSTAWQQLPRGSPTALQRTAGSTATQHPAPRPASRPTPTPAAARTPTPTLSPGTHGTAAGGCLPSRTAPLAAASGWRSSAMGRRVSATRRRAARAPSPDRVCLTPSAPHSHEDHQALCHDAPAIIAGWGICLLVDSHLCSLLLWPARAAGPGSIENCPRPLPLSPP